MTRIARASVFVLLTHFARGRGRLLEARPNSEPLEAGRPPVAVSVEPAAAADLQETIDVVGTLEPKFTADVKSEVTGVVTEVYVTEWVPVKRGDKLARLDSRETEAGIETLRAAEAQAKVGQNRAQREYERAQQLKQYGLITPQALDDAKTAVEASDAAMTAARAQIKAAETRLAKLLITVADGRRRGAARRQRGRPRREHGRQRVDVPDRGQPRARPDGVGAVVAARVGARRADARVLVRDAARPHVHREGDVHQPGHRRGQPVGEGRRRGARTRTAP